MEGREEQAKEEEILSGEYIHGMTMMPASSAIV